MLDILRAMGADLELSEERITGGEPVADIVVRSSTMRSTTVSGAVVPRAIDELPLVAILGCFAEGETVVKDASELLVKESDRVAAVVDALARLGARITPRPDGFVIQGPVLLRGGTVDGGGDHRIGMLGGIAGMLAEGQTKVLNDAVGVSYPSFWDDLKRASA